MTSKTLTQPTTSPFGTHRAADPSGSLPYAARRLDANLPLHEGEVLLDVEALNLDSASFTQLAAEVAGDPEALGRRVLQIVSDRGKMHNPVTGSGGVLIGRVAQAPRRSRPEPGARVVSLASLTTTPLDLSRIVGVDMRTHQVQVEGRAILFERTPYAILDGSLPDSLAMSVLDVCGAALQARRHIKTGDAVVVAGAAGKSGLLVTWMGAAAGARMICLVRDDAERDRLGRLPLNIQVEVVDATDPLAVHDRVHRITRGALADVVFNCVNVPGVEMSCILAARPRGIVCFFSMATSFQAAALGAEAVGADVDLLIGNGFADGHADLGLSLVRDNPPLRAALEACLGPAPAAE